MFKDADAVRGRFGEAQCRPRVTSASDLVTLTLRLMKDDPLSLSIAVVDPTKVGKVPWEFLPKSQIEYVEIGTGIVEVTMPEWLAKSKGLV
jgi:hypothetical protein